MQILVERLGDMDLTVMISYTDAEGLPASVYLGPLQTRLLEKHLRAARELDEATPSPEKQP